MELRGAFEQRDGVCGLTSTLASPGMFLICRGFQGAPLRIASTADRRC